MGNPSRSEFLRFNLPCKSYVRHYLEMCFGTPAYIRGESAIGKYFFNLVDRSTEEQDSKCKNDYEATATIIITERIFLRHGYVLSKTNTREFNKFVEDLFKEKIRLMICALVEFQGVQINQAIEIVYEKFNMDETIMPHELIRKDYQRYRKRSEAA